jgi:hypothetical protein
LEEPRPLYTRAKAQASAVSGGKLPAENEERAGDRTAYPAAPRKRTRAGVSDLALFDVLDTLASNPDAFPGQVRAISLDGRVRLYSHLSPPLQVTFEVDTSRRVLYLLHFVSPRIQITKPVFISYSHKDAKWLDKLKQFLRPLEEQDLIRVWDDTEIRPGADWLADIRKAFESARVAVFLVTQNLLDSPFIIDKELPVLVGGRNQSRLSDLLDCRKLVDHRRFSVSQISGSYLTTLTAGSHVGTRAGESAP